MSPYDEYRVKAAECQTMAKIAENEWDKSQWLRLAELWLRLIRDDGQAGAAFDTEHAARGTGQRESKSSH